MEFKQYLVIGALSMGLLTGCGSDSDSDSAESYGATYSGSTEAGVISEDTKAAFETSAVEISKGLIASSSFNIFLFALPDGDTDSFGLRALGVESSGDAVVNIAALNTVKQLALSLKTEVNTSLPIGSELSEEIVSECESIQGSVVVSKSTTLSEGSNSVVTTMTFNDYCNNDDSPIDNLFYNGKVTMTSTESETEDEDSSSQRVEYNNLSITFPEAEPETGVTSLLFNGFDEYVEAYIFEDNSDTYRYSVELTMEAGILSGSFSNEGGCVIVGGDRNCTDTSEFTALDGKTYRIDDRRTGPYSGKAYDPALGYFDMNGSNISWCFDAEGGAHLDQGGEITLLDDAGTELVIDVTACGVYESSITPEAEAPEAD